MSETIERASDLLRTRLTELNEEHAKVEKALRSLPDKNRNSASRQASTNGTAPRRRKRAPRGKRRADFLEALGANPTGKLSDVAESIGVGSSQASALATTLVKAGQITKTGRGTYRLNEAG
jgi:IclR helix-turn-helix domain